MFPSDKQSTTEIEMNMQFNRREFLTAAAAMASTPWLGGCLTGKQEEGPLVIAQCGDPQLGFGEEKDSHAADLARARREIEIINSISPDLVLFQGDMANVVGTFDRDWPALLKTIKNRVVAVPGNHDMGNALIGDNADRFRKVFGAEYQAFTIKGWRFIAGNSQYWRPTPEKARQQAYEKWFADELRKAEAEHCKTIIATHIPPFAVRPGEKDSYNNYPLKNRTRRLESYLKAGTRFYLAGHTHRNHRNTYRGMTILNPETTCRNFDKRPFGFRLLTIRPDATYDWKFIPVA